METIPDKEKTFASSAIYKVCLPRNRLATLWKSRGAQNHMSSQANMLSKENGLKTVNPVTHVMYEAQVIQFNG